MDTAGYLITDHDMMTSAPGIFAAGEIQDPKWRQIATSVGQGTAAAMACTRWMEEHEEEMEAVAAGD
jgi:thioredoxin reductase (NADPH)